MKGLIRKDLYCLKKDIATFLTVTIGVMIISVLFVLSTQYGNLADAKMEIYAESQIAKEFCDSAFEMVMVLTLFLPMALLGNITECFKEDKRAGFTKVLFSMPFTGKQIVGSRYLTCILFAGAGLLASLICALAVAGASEQLQLELLVGSSVSACAFFIFYMSLVLFLLYLFEADKADFIQSAPFIVFGIIGIYTYAVKIGTLPEEEMLRASIEMTDKLKTFFQKKYMILYAVSIVCFSLSYLASVKVFEKKKEAA